MAEAVLDGKKRFEERLQAESDKQRLTVSTHRVESGESDVPESIETKGSDIGETKNHAEEGK
jgi:small subunit ribosomal protein S2